MIGRIVLLVVVATSTANAVVLCAKPRKDGTFNTSVKIREACKSSEMQLDPGDHGLQGCPPDSVVSGTVCMDTYEASVWRVPDPAGANQSLVKKLQQGKATAADLTAGGATLLGTGTAGDDYAPCADSGQNCADDIYAVSLPGVTPSSVITWFQAQQACKNARKRLPSNAEWQAAVAGTPDPGSDNSTMDCNTGSPVATGSHSRCVSADGAFDMVGNLDEWVADWVPRSTNCGSWSVGVSPAGDFQCLAGAATTGEPGALLRGGTYLYLSFGTNAGPFTVLGQFPPSYNDLIIGFRCAR